MSLAVHSISEAPLATQAEGATSRRKPPPSKRIVIANRDAIAQPEPR
jgi:hypothetical protein